MRTIFIITILSCFLIINTDSLKSQQSIEEEQMTKLINEIIETPARMFETMENNKSIDCTEIIKLYDEVNWILIDFTMRIARLKCMNYTYDGIDTSINSETQEKVYYYYFVINKGQEDEDLIAFRFYKYNKKLKFDGLLKIID